MDRVSLLASGCTAIVVVLVFQTPPQLASNFSWGNWIKGVPSPRVVQQSSPNPGRARLNPPVKATVEERRIVQTAFFIPAIPAPPAVAAQKPAKPARPVNVVKDAVHLHALNHAGSEVVATLQKGEVVEPQMQVNENGEEWVYVTAPALRVSGYLQSDWLELK